MQQRRNFVISYFMCTNCGHESIPLARRSSNKKKWGHLKRMYCPYCQREYNAFEIVNDYDKEVFYKLFENGAFKQDCLKLDQEHEKNKEIVEQVTSINKNKRKKENIYV